MDEKIIAENIKKLRTQKGITLQELATSAGLTKGYLSKVERSKKAPPYSTLTKIAGGLGIEVATLLAQDIAPLDDVRFCLSRGEDRKLIRSADQVAGYDYEILAGKKPGKNMEPFIIHAPFDITRTYSHEGEELNYVMDGQVEFHYGDDIHILNPGDNIYFDSIVPHVGRSIGDKQARLLVVIYFYKRNRQ